MQSDLNFTCKFFRRKDRVWGGRFGNGTFYGMVGDVHSGRFDLIGTSLTLRPGRAQGVAFLSPIAVETYGLFVPSSERYRIK